MSDEITQTAPGPLALEDLQIGQRFTSGQTEVDIDHIKSFASQYDPQYFHLDEDAAASSLFGGLAASGWHTAAMSMRLIVDSHIFANGMIGAGVEIAWPRPTRPGDILHVDSEILDIAPSKSRPDRGMVTLQSTTINQNGEAVQILTSKVIVFRRNP